MACIPVWSTVEWVQINKTRYRRIETGYFTVNPPWQEGGHWYATLKLKGVSAYQMKEMKKQWDKRKNFTISIRQGDTIHTAGPFYSNGINVNLRDRSVEIDYTSRHGYYDGTKYKETFTKLIHDE